MWTNVGMRRSKTLVSYTAFCLHLLISAKAASFYQAKRKFLSFGLFHFFSIPVLSFARKGI